MTDELRQRRLQQLRNYNRWEREHTDGKGIHILDWAAQEIERLDNVINKHEREKQHVLSEVREALNDPTITGYEQIATGIRDLRTEYEEQEPTLWIDPEYINERKDFADLEARVWPSQVTKNMVPLYVLPASRKWIKCSDRMPEHTDLVLCYKDYGDGSIDFWIACISTHTGRFIRTPDAKSIEPTHWSDLIKPL